MSVSIGFTHGTPVAQRTGTVYSTYSAIAADTNINLWGGASMALPAAPSTNQTIVVTNTGTSAATVTGGTAPVTIQAGQSAKFIYVSNTGTGGTGGSLAVVWAFCAQATTLPVPYTFPTRQFAGPSATPYTPFVTHENILVAATECGDAIYRVKTLTYTNRAVANLYKTVDGRMFATAGGFFYTSPLVTAIGASTGELRVSIVSQLGPILPAHIAGGSSSPWTGFPMYGFTPSYVNKVISSPIFVSYDYYYADLYTITGPITGQGMSPTWTSITRPTLYYLDVTEDWSYVLL